MKIKILCDGNVNSAKITNAETGEIISDVTKAHIILDGQKGTSTVYLEFCHVPVNVHGNLDEINPPPGMIEDDINKH